MTKIIIISIRIPQDLWRQAKIKMVDDGESFQSISIKALENYVKEEINVEKLLEIIEETGKVAMSSIDNVNEVKQILKENGYTTYLDASTDYLIAEKY